MIALKMVNDLSDVIEVNITQNINDESKNSAVIEIQNSDSESETGEMLTCAYYINDKEQCNALISKLVELKKLL